MWVSRPLRVVLFAFFLVASADRRALAQGTAQVPLPPGIGRHDVAHADGALRTLLARHAEGWLATHAHAQSGSGESGGAPARGLSSRGTMGGTKVGYAADGTPILPDLEAAASGVGRLTAVGAELTFTFDSPDAPWTGAEIQRMQGILRLCQRRRGSAPKRPPCLRARSPRSPTP